MKILARHCSVLILALSCFAVEANGISDETKSNETDTPIEYILRLFGDPPAAAVVLNLPEKKNSSLNYRFAAERQDEKISLILESMTCRPNGDEEPSPSLLILGDDSFLDICANIVYPEDSFDAVKYSLAGEHSYEIKLQGDWTRSKAVLVATVYKEATSCSKCPKNTFCCAGGTKCKGETRDRNPESARCISGSLLCDRHPNCGMVCNADESDEQCKPPYYIDFNFGYMTILAFTFLMLLPCAIILLGCYHRHLTQMKRLRALELRRRQNLENIGVTSTILLNDHPPTYAEVHETQEQPPCFCEAIKLPKTTQSSAATTNGVDHIGVGAEGNEQNCNCGKNAGQQRY